MEHSQRPEDLCGVRAVTGEGSKKEYRKPELTFHDDLKSATGLAPVS
jgi:hypothetical protein